MSGVNEDRLSDDGVAEAGGLTLESGAPLGLALRARRQELNLSLVEISAHIRLPSRVLDALEDEDLVRLPSRPFTLGHTRAYAQYLGLNETLAVERMRALYDEPEVRLEAPVGVAHDDKPPRSPLWFIVPAALVAAVIGWNVFQRLSLIHAPQRSDLAEIPDSWTLTDGGQMTLGPTRPAPPDQSTPPPYITPGLEDVLTPALFGAMTPAIDTGEPVGAAFNPRGTVFGEPALSSGVILQARRPVTMVVRTPDGNVRFGRQLARGEAWRAPRDQSLVIDVSDPAQLDLFLNGERVGVLDQPLTQLATLNSRADTLARQAVAEAEARERAAEQAAQARLRAVEAAPPAPSQAIADPTAPIEDTLPPPPIQTAPLTRQ